MEVALPLVLLGLAVLLVLLGLLVLVLGLLMVALGAWESCLELVLTVQGAEMRPTCGWHLRLLG